MVSTIIQIGRPCLGRLYRRMILRCTASAITSADNLWKAVSCPATAGTWSSGCEESRLIVASVTLYNDIYDQIIEERINVFHLHLPPQILEN